MVKIQSKSKGLAKRIVPCLDVKNGETVKGTNFVNLRSAGDPVELGKAYSDAGADELVFLDITASFEERKTFTDMVTRVAAEINIPFTVGGGINELKDVDRLLNAGADKVSINSAAIRHPELIDEIANHYGSQVCVCAIDARLDSDGWHCYVKGGRERVELGLFDWAILHELTSFRFISLRSFFISNVILSLDCLCAFISLHLSLQYPESTLYTIKFYFSTIFEIFRSISI